MYKTYWRDNITPKIESLDPSVVWQPYFDPVTQTPYPVNMADIFNAIDNVPIDSLKIWHSNTADYANSARPNMGVNSFYEVGTNSFDSLLNIITQLKLPVLIGGSKIVDKSALYHGHAEKIFDSGFCQNNYWRKLSRMYTPKSNGSLFSDTNNIKIVNIEGGILIRNWGIRFKKNYCLTN